jgi:hypothetical protein
LSGLSKRWADEWIIIIKAKPKIKIRKSLAHHFVPILRNMLIGSDHHVKKKTAPGGKSKIACTLWRNSLQKTISEILTVLL